MSNNPRIGTALFIFSILLCIAAYDLIVVVRAHRATISSLILDASFSRPWGLLIPLAFGVLMGHLFVPQKGP